MYHFCGLNSIDKLQNPLEALHIHGCLSTIRICMQIHTHVATCICAYAHVHAMSSSVGVAKLCVMQGCLLL